MAHLQSMTRFVLGNLLAGPSTRRYPYFVRPSVEGSRGRIVIDYPACIHCGACARRCPANAIVVGKDPKSWSIDRFACVSCGLCVRVCPKKCLGMDAERPKVSAYADLASRVERLETQAAEPAGSAPPAASGAGGGA